MSKKIPFSLNFTYPGFIVYIKRAILLLCFILNKYTFQKLYENKLTNNMVQEKEKET